jgi:phosphoribosylaminoimidazole-succinocarboxamide synthase
MNDIADMAIRVNDFMAGLFAAIGIRLVDFKLEFGRVWEMIIPHHPADEISPDGCRLWDMRSGEKLDKDRFRRAWAAKPRLIRKLRGGLACSKGQEGRIASSTSTVIARSAVSRTSVVIVLFHDTMMNSHSG